MVEISYEKIFRKRRYVRTKVHIKGITSVPEDSKLLAKGTAVLHKLEDGNLVACVDAFMYESGCFCPYCEYSNNTKRYARFELYTSPKGELIYRKMRGTIGRVSTVPIFTIVATWMPGKYKQPFHMSTLKGLEYFPSHLIPQIHALHSKWTEYSDLKIKEFLDDNT